MSQINQKGQDRSRRVALKALAAAAGAAALSALPNRWETPRIEVGSLPAFAQTSAPSVSNISSNFTGTNNCNAGTGSSQTISFDYNDPTGNITSAAVIQSRMTLLPSGLNNSSNIAITAGNVTQVGDQFSGTISLDFCTRFNADTSIQDEISIVNGLGQTSGIISVTTAKPAGALGREGGDGPGSRIPLP